MTFKRSLNQMVDPGLVSNPLTTAESFDNVPASRVPANPATSGGGLVSPITWDVVTTEIIAIPVPDGATSVDFERVKTLTETDANGTVNDITINYPV